MVVMNLVNNLDSDVGQESISEVLTTDLLFQKESTGFSLILNVISVNLNDKSFPARRTIIVILLVTLLVPSRRRS